MFEIYIPIVVDFTANRGNDIFDCFIRMSDSEVERGTGKQKWEENRHRHSPVCPPACCRSIKAFRCLTAIPFLFFRIAIFGVLLSSRLTSVHTTMLSNENGETTSRTASFIYATPFPLCLARRYTSFFCLPSNQAVTIVCMGEARDASSTHFRLFCHSVPSYTSLNFIIPSRWLAHEAVYKRHNIAAKFVRFRFRWTLQGRHDFLSRTCPFRLCR